MGDPDDGTETVQAGPARPPLLPPLPDRWRGRLTTVAACAFGLVLGGAAVLWWRDEPTPAPRVRADEHDVELVLFEVRSPTGTARPLRVDGAVLLSGTVASTVTGIETSGGIDVLAPELPVTVAPKDRFRTVGLRVSVTDCERARRWEPSDRPFTITWQDEFDREHTDRAGDLSEETGDALRRYVDAVCAE